MSLSEGMRELRTVALGYDRLQYDKLREAQVEGTDQNRNNPPRRGIG